MTIILDKLVKFYVTLQYNLNITMNNKEFLRNSDETGRHIVTSFRTGKKYYVEPIGNGRMADWGSYNPGTGNIENKKGAGKYSGSVTEDESLITAENGFVNIEVIDNGSPYSVIDKLDAKYPTINK